MKLFRRPENFERMHRMADAVGVDLHAVVAEGTLDARDLRVAATRCGECSGSLECRIWLQARQDHADEAPRYCPNRALYRALKETE